MGIFKKALHSKIDVFVKFESAINLEIRGQILKKTLDSFYLGYKDHMYALSSKSGSEPFRFALFLGDLRWNDPKHKKKLIQLMTITELVLLILNFTSCIVCL